MRYGFRPVGTCSKQIVFDIEDGNVHNIVFVGGCDGNLKAIQRLAEGMDAAKLADMLAGITCGNKPTSCGDQFSQALKLALARENETNAVQEQ